MKRIPSIISAALVLASLCSCGRADVSVYDLKTEGRTCPEGIDEFCPRLSWKMESEGRGVEQTAYRVRLSAGNRLVWDSGKVASDASVFVPYGGEVLAPETDYSWKVKVWTSGGESRWSPEASFSTGLQDSTGWAGAQWIGVDENVGDNVQHLAARYLRRDFRVKKKVKSARLYFIGLGTGVVTVNGERVCEDVFAHPPVLFDKALYYRTYDVTDLLKKGDNALGVVLGSGRFQSKSVWTLRCVSDPRMLLCLRLRYADGSSENIVSDTSWQATSKGPITSQNEYDGEYFDAGMDLGRWDLPGYECDERWQEADLLLEFPKAGLCTHPRAMTMDDMAVMERFAAKGAKEASEGRYIVDMGQNMVGHLRVRLSGRSGVPVVFNYAENLTAAGDSLEMSNLRSVLATDQYTPDRDGEFEWEPLFPFHGFRYVQIEGVDKAPEAADIIGCVKYDKMQTVGRFTCSDERLNKLYHNIFWGVRGNYRGMPMDCPQRDERQGWLGDRGATVYGEPYMLDVSRLYRKWMDDIYESMVKNRISVVSPRYWSIFNNDMAASSVFVYTAEMLYTRYGDFSGIEEFYPAMKAWLLRVTDKNLHDGIFTMKKDEYKDWCVPPESPEIIHSQDPARITSSEVIQTGILCGTLEKMAHFAQLTGHEEDIPVYEGMLASVKEAYNARFFDPVAARYDNGTLTADLIPLAFGIVPEGREEDVMRTVVEKIEGDWNGHVGVGNVGIRYLMQTLTHRGQLELAYRLATQDTYPGWGYMIKKGATTIWELWNGDFADPAMNSGNHVMMIGDLLSWYYEDLAGIKNDPADVAFRKIWMQPCFPRELGSVSASFDSPFGVIRSAWKLDYEEDDLDWEVTVPAGSSATVVLPAVFNVDPDGCAAEVEGDFQKIFVPSGTYHFKTVK